MSVASKFDAILEKSEKLERELSDVKDHIAFATLSKEYSALKPIAEKIKNFKNIEKEIADLKLIIASEEEGLKEIAIDELALQEKAFEEADQDLKISLLPKDEDDERNAILEIRAGTGGDEAALFAGVLLTMYQKFAELQDWKCEILNSSYNDLGGIKEIVCLISGRGVFAKLKFESGTHRVQRIPETETNGRIHTSAATVAVLPELEDIDFAFEEKDLKIETTRSSGAGGQHVNTTDSAIRIVHLPTGIVVVQQDQRSQLRNKEKALKILRSRVYDLEKTKRDSQRAEARKSQIGTGDRSGRIRTYNYPQNRITDHRINFSVYKIVEITVEGKLDFLIDELTKEDIAMKLASQI